MAYDPIMQFKQISKSSPAPPGLLKSRNIWMSDHMEVMLDKYTVAEVTEYNKFKFFARILF